MLHKRPLLSMLRHRAMFLMIAASTFSVGSIAATFWLIHHSSNEEKPILCIVNSDYILSVCDLLADPNRFKSDTVRVRATLVGYHELVLYDSKCSGENEVLRVSLDQPLRQKLITGVDALKGRGFVQGNFHATVTIVGRFEQEQDEDCKSESGSPKNSNHRYTRNCFVIIAADVESVEGAV